MTRPLPSRLVGPCVRLLRPLSLAFLIAASLTMLLNAAGVWSAATSLPVAIQEVSVIAVNGRVYVIGGSTNQTRFNSVYMLDPAAASPAWATRTPYPGTARDHIGIAANSNFIYLVGGVSQWPSPSVNTVQRYDTTTDTWANVAPLPVARGAIAMAALNGRIYAAGGLVNGTAVSDFTVYDPATDAWQTLTGMPTARDHAVAVAMNGKIYVTGGRTTSTCAPLRTVEVYDPTANAWSVAAPMAQARGGHGAAAVNGRLYVFGGEGAPTTCGVIGSAEQYDPSTNTWSAAPPMLTPRHGTGGAVVGPTIYVPGGATTTGDAPTSVVEALDPAAVPTVPAPWTSMDIGTVGVEGSANESGGVFTVRGAGADIWGSADAFQFVSQPISGDSQIIARITSVQNTNAYAKAGVMMRAARTAGSAHVILDVKPGGGLEFMIRSANGGVTTFIAGGTAAAPLWVKLARSGSTVIGSWSANGAAWTEVGRTTISLPSPFYIGMAVSSHNTAVLNTSTFDTVSVGSGPVNQPPTVSVTSPANGATFQAPASIALAAVASDPDGTISSVQFFANGTAIGTDPTSPYGITWNQSTPGTYSLTALATDSGGAQTTSAPVTVSVLDPNSPLPAPWAHGDIGAVGLAGSASHSNGLFTIKGAGADIWDRADSFHFMYQPLTGDGQITVRVASVQNTNTFAKAGVMFRQSLTAGSPHVLLSLRPNGGVEFMTRTTGGGVTTFLAGQTLGIPGWLKLIRKGDSFISYTSADGSAWTQLGSTTVALGTTVYVGVPVLSHNTAALNTSTFDNVSVSNDATPPAGAIGFQRKAIAVGGAASGTAFGITGFSGPSSLQLGPDGRLYVSTAVGHLYILTLDSATLADPARISVTHVQQLDDIYLKPSRTCNIGGVPDNCAYLSPSGSGRLVTGILIDPASTPAQLTLYVSNSGMGQNTTDMALDTHSGTITRLRLVPNGATADPDDFVVAENTDLVVGLPRSREVHAVNGMSIGPDGWLYLAVGGHTNAGQPSQFFANLPEYYLSASVVRLNLAQLGGRALPIDVSEVTSAAQMTPLAGVFELFAAGYRNAYDLTWHSNGKLYLNDNAANLGQGNTPGAADGCNTPSIVPGNRPDDLNLVTRGAYGGHPNPARGECVFDDGTLYSPPLAPLGSYVRPLLSYLDGSSTNGIIEYRSNAFGGEMKGNLISATYSGNQNVRRVVLDSTGTVVVKEQNLAQFVQPLDVATDLSGNIYVAEYGANRITVMLPMGLGMCPVPGSDPASTDSDGDGYTDADESANGTDVCSPASRPADFDADRISDLSDSDDDNDGIPDVADQLFFDAQNGATTAIPFAVEYNPTDGAAGYVANTGFRGVQIATSGVRLSPSTIKAGDAGGHLTLTTHAGTAAGGANNQVNALQIGFDSTSPFRIWTRVVQPFSATSPASGHAGGVFFGPDQDNFFRFAVVGTSSGSIAVEAGLERNGIFAVQGIALVSGAPVANIDLFLIGDPAAHMLSAYVDVNTSGVLSAIALNVPAPATWFANNTGATANTSLAGLMTSHGSAQPTAFGFDFFRLDRSVPVPPTVDPPATPSNPIPAAGADNVSAMSALFWAPSDRATQYDVALGTTTQPPIVSTGQPGTYYQPAAPLAYATTYYWRITAKGPGGQTQGPLWSFTTEPAQPPPPPPPPSTTLRRLRVLTWNVNAGRDRSGASNVDAQVSLMARSGAHVIVLQEVTIETGADLRALYQSKLEEATGRTWNAVWAEEPRPAPATPQGNLVLTWLPLASFSTLTLDAAPFDATNTDAQRSAARIAVVVNGVTVTVATTMLASDPTSRQVQIDRLQSWMSTATAPRLIGGSFNMRSTDPGYSDMASAARDVWSALVTTPDGGTTVESFGTAGQPGRVDDWWQDLGTPRALATEVWIVKTGRSDHHAVIAEVNVR